MPRSMCIHGETEEKSGFIVGINMDESSFIYDEFSEDNIKNIKLKIVLEVADISKNDICYLPMKNKFVISTDESEKSEKFPILKNPSSVDTETVVLYGGVLESSGIISMKDMISNALEMLDSMYPIHQLWYKIRGEKISLEGINVNNTTIAGDVKIENSITDSNYKPELAQEAHDAFKTEISNKADPTNFEDRIRIRMQEDNISRLDIQILNDYMNINDLNCTLELNNDTSWVVNCDKPKERY